MVAGIVDHETGTRDMRKLGGLAKYMPHTAALGTIAAMAMAGVPLFNGFLSKEMFFTEAVREAGSFGPIWLLPLLVALGGLMSVAYSLRFVHDTFFGKSEGELPKTPHEPPSMMKRPVDLLVVLCLAVGIVPSLIVGPLLHMTVTGVLQAPPPEYGLYLWHGFNLPLMMSIFALIGGVLVYFKRERLFKMHYRSIHHIDARVAYNLILDSTTRACEKITNRFDQGKLGPIVLYTSLFTLVAGLIGYRTGGGQFGLPQANGTLDGTFDWLTFLGILVIIAATIITTLFHHRRLFAVIVLSVVGIGVSMLFARFSAPDLAMTQISVEVVTIILLLLALYYLPQHSHRLCSNFVLRRDAIIAGVFGVGVTAFTFAIISQPFESISDFFLYQSVPGGGGTNVVNVILVDFRGYDTFGEVVVVGLAALGIYAMLKNMVLPASMRDPDGRNWTEDPHPLLLRTFAQILLPLTLLFGLYIFLRGHNMPGGGFIAGLIVASALVAQYVANGIRPTEARMTLPIHGMLSTGILIALGTGIASMLLGYPFLTSAYTYVSFPWIGEVEFTSALPFDLGVFLVVVSSAILILLNLGRLTNRSVKVPDYRVAQTAQTKTEDS